MDKELEKLEKIPTLDLTKVKSKKEVIDEARTKDVKLHVASLMEICHLTNAELETKHQKYKGRVVLRNDIEKNASESYTVFTEQGSFASQKTAAKVMDIMSKLSESAGQPADALFDFTQKKWKMLARHLDSSTTTQNGLSHGPVCTVGRRFPIGNVSLYIVKKGFSYLCLWMTSNCLERLKILFGCGMFSIKKSIWENQHLYLIIFNTRQCEMSKNVVDNHKTMFESRVSAGGTRGYVLLRPILLRPIST